MGRLSQRDLDIVGRYGGIDPVLVEQAAEQRHDRAASEAQLIASREAAALTADEVAKRLGTDVDDVRRLAANRDLYVLPDGAGLFPTWQFVAVPASGLVRPLPHMAEVLAALPAPTHPATLERFFTRPWDIYDRSSAAAWLARGGDPQPVLYAAASMHALG